MKKYLLGAFAVALAVGFSSYTSVKKFSDYWVPTTTQTIVSGHIVANADLDFSNYTTSDPSSCSGGNKYCVAKFTTSQLNFDTQGNPISLVNGQQTPTGGDLQP